MRVSIAACVSSSGPSKRTEIKYFPSLWKANTVNMIRNPLICIYSSWCKLVFLINKVQGFVFRKRYIHTKMYLQKADENCAKAKICKVFISIKHDIPIKNDNLVQGTWVKHVIRIWKVFFSFVWGHLSVEFLPWTIYGLKKEGCHPLTNKDGDTDVELNRRYPNSPLVRGVKILVKP